MGRLKSLSFAALGFAAGLSVLPDRAAACSCVRPTGSMSEYRASIIAESAIAFTGRVVAVRRVTGERNAPSNIVAEIAVSDRHKGRVGRTAFVVTDGDAGGATCSFAGPLMAGLETRRPLTLVSNELVRIGGVRAYPVNICSSGPFLSRD